MRRRKPFSPEASIQASEEMLADLDARKRAMESSVALVRQGIVEVTDAIEILHEFIKSQRELLTRRPPRKRGVKRKAKRK